MGAPSTVEHELLARILAGTPAGESPLLHVRTFPEARARTVGWPSWAPEPLVAAFQRAGLDRPWTHQAEAAELAWSGSHVVLATGTASGKSLGYQLPVLAALLGEPKSTALYLAPTKALGADQLRAIRDLDLPGIRPAGYDGDTPRAERDWARAHGRWLFSNPDMLHRGILPAHGRWSNFFRRLRYVVIDECHTYRGVFGSHVALLLRRLRRVAARYGAEPVFVLASATVSDPAVSASRLTGLPSAAVTADGSPRGARTVALWEPPLTELHGEHGAPVRRSAGSEAARIMADLVVDGARTLTFVRSRSGAEFAALGAKRILSEVDGELADRVAAYRAGYLPEDRRRLEKRLLSGELLGVATTSALELGVDIAGLDAVVVAGYPGTLASFWQQAGRAGRRGDGALVIFVARDDPLDTYLVHHPKAMFDRPVEATVLDPGNPYVLAPQLACAAAELPLTEDCLPAFGGDTARAVLDELVADGVLRRRSAGWYWTERERPHGSVDIRGSGGDLVAVVEGDSGRLVGTVAPESACSTVFPGAVYLHQGDSYLVDELDLDAGIALVHQENPDWSTSPRTVVDIAVVRTVERRDYDGVSVCLGEVDVTSQVVGFLRRLPSGEVLDQVPLDLPEQTLRTRAVWYTLSQELLARYGFAAGSGARSRDGDRHPEPGKTNGGNGNGTDAGTGNPAEAAGPGVSNPARLPGALHAAEHAAIGMLPLFATCDRWDIGGVSTALHPDTAEATVFVHDGHPGGAGFADRAHSALVPWLTATREAIAACECRVGCPSCVQSPKCGNGNEPLDKAGAVLVLDAVLGAVSADNAPARVAPN